MADNNIRHPRGSLSKYKAIKLENGLCAVLVHDNMCRGESPLYPAAASMAVRCGSFFNPPEFQGLAHFLEHMLFMGSKKFPTSDRLSFSILEISLLFWLYISVGKSQFFIAPLLDSVCVEREICAVDAEFQIRKQVDSVRLEQLRAHTSKKGHIFNRFSCGNKESLSKENLREHAKKLYDECYLGGAMNLCVIGGQSLDVLEKWVRQFFGPVRKGPPKTISIPAFNIRGPIWDPSISYGLKAAEDGHFLELLWMLPPLSNNFYSERPEQYLVKLLAQQGKGSLSSFFKNEGWTNSLKVKLFFGGNHCTSVGRMFVIFMDLTLSGLEKRYELITYTYQYLKLLRDTTPQRWVMNEIWKIKKVEYDLEANTYPPDFAELLSGNMLVYPLTHVISADYFSNWKPKAIRDLMQYLTPERMRVDFVSKSVKETELIEPWCNSFYMEEQIPPEIREAWSNTSELHASLFFPSENNFIPTSFNERDHEDMPLPECIVDTPSLKLWYYRKDVPTSYLYFRIYRRGGYSSVKNHLMTELFTELLKDELNDILYQSEAARLSSSITLLDDELLLKVSGYREKLRLLLSEIWTSFRTFSPTTNRFEIIKEKIKKDMNNMKIMELSNYMLFQILKKKSYSMSKKLQVLNRITFADFERFVDGIRSEIFIEGLCTGDVLLDEAIEISNIFSRTRVEPLRHNNSIMRLRTKLRRIHVKVSDSNSLIKLYFQIGRDKGKHMRKMAMIDLFDGIIREMLFSKLRNEEQLGYVVECSPHLTCGVHGFSIFVLSKQHNPLYLLERVCNFVNLIGGLLKQVTDEAFEDYKNAVISRLRSDRSATWKEIVSRRYIFDSKDFAELKRIQKKAFIRWYKKYFKPSSSSCRRIVLCLWGSEINMKRNGLRHVKFPRLLRLSSTRLSHKTYKVRKLTT